MSSCRTLRASLSCQIPTIKFAFLGHLKTLRCPDAVSTDVGTHHFRIVSTDRQQGRHQFQQRRLKRQHLLVRWWRSKSSEAALRNDHSPNHASSRPRVQRSSLVLADIESCVPWIGKWWLRLQIPWNKHREPSQTSRLQQDLHESAQLGIWFISKTRNRSYCKGRTIKINLSAAEALITMRIPMLFRSPTPNLVAYIFYACLLEKE